MAAETKRKKRLDRRPSSHFKRWTAAEDSTLKQMVEAGNNTRQIAKVMGRTGPSIWGRKQFLGIEDRISSSPHGTSPYNSRAGHRKEAFEEARQQGASTAVLELTETVGRLAKKLGVKATLVVFE